MSVRGPDIGCWAVPSEGGFSMSYFLPFVLNTFGVISIDSSSCWVLLADTNSPILTFFYPSRGVQALSILLRMFILIFRPHRCIMHTPASQETPYHRRLAEMPLLVYVLEYRTIKSPFKLSPSLLWVSLHTDNIIPQAPQSPQWIHRRLGSPKACLKCSLNNFHTTPIS